MHAPDAVLAPVGTIVWWGFHRDQAKAPRHLPLSPVEQTFLESQGVELPDPVAETSRQSDRWSRPLRMATDTLLLVCPRTDATGTPAHPHPLWDEIRARVMKGEERVLTRSRPAAADALATELPRLAQPTAPGHFTMPAMAVTPRDAESASSLGTLASCGFHWLMRYPAKLRAGRTRSLPEGPLLEGNLLHHCLAHAFAAFDAFDAFAAFDATRIEDAVARAVAFFDEQLPRIAGSLAQPTAGAPRTRLRRLLEIGTRDFATRVAAGGLRIGPIEASLQKAVPDPWRTVKSIPDMLLVDPATGAPVVIDFKLGGKHDEKLQDGIAFQLATYAFLAQEEGRPFPDAGYYIVGKQRLACSTSIATTPPVTPDAPLSETWRGLVAAARASWEALQRGEVVVPDPDAKAKLDGGYLTLPPECGHCDFGLLCGVDLPEATS